MIKIGDKVRFLSEVGGGKVTGFQGKDIVLVERSPDFKAKTSYWWKMPTDSTSRCTSVKWW